MRLVFDEKDSLALKSLQEGVVDFHDKRVQIKGAGMAEQNIMMKGRDGKPAHELFEVDLGELKSLKENQIHIDELSSGTKTIEKGQ
jgi:hypothetical protein